MWTATDANGQWAAVDPGVGPDVDLIASGPRRYNYRGLVILGSQRTAAFYDEEDGWYVRTLDIAGEPIAYAEGLAITDSGEILEIDEFARAKIVETGVQSRGVAWADFQSWVLVGPGGRFDLFYEETCDYP